MHLAMNVELVKHDERLEAQRPTRPEGRQPEKCKAEPWAIAAISILGALTVAYGFWLWTLAGRIDRKLAAGAFSDTVNIYSAPEVIATGDSLTSDQVVERLRQSGYSTSRQSRAGWYHLRPDGIEIFPGPDSPSGIEPALLRFARGKLAGIVSLQDQTERSRYQLEPQLIANLSGEREQRRLVHFSDIPPRLVHAVVSAEDKRFFRHNGVDAARILKAAYVDLKDGRKEQGASTITQQLARGLWLDPDKSWKRKFEEMLITFHLEQKLTKEQIFEDYANQVYLGRWGPFSINGFGQASFVYFGKTLPEISNAQAAMLAGMVQRPTFFNPRHQPERTLQRRNQVLTLMHQNGYLNDAEYQEAVASPLGVTAEAPSTGLGNSYFLDLVNNELQSRLDDHERTTRSIVTSLDPELQAAAEEAVRKGMQNVDKLVQKRRDRKSIPAGQPQVALIALDPHTGEIKAVVGGRNYAASQLNHVLANRQPGSVFKPFVYAAALNTAVRGGNKIFTPASIVDDSPTTFQFASGPYSPKNFDNQFMGPVTLRTALAHSLNVATVKLAQEVGYEQVVDVARAAGLNDRIQPTPAVALGAYEATPLEIAGAYTVFANSGKRVSPSTVSLVRAQDGTVLYQHQADPTPAMDPRVSYLMVNMLKEVLRSGTGAGVRGMGFNAPAAGKTGTSRDGWFAGFTSELLCVVWVGFDDNRDLDLEGAHSALPIWGEFMKAASQLRNYRDVRDFTAPKGIVSAQICNDSGQLAGPNCPRVHSEVFISGTEPPVQCQMHSPASDDFAGRVIDPDDPPPSSINPANAANFTSNR